MRVARQLGQLLRGQRFRQLFAVRLTSQLSDGVFQAALASYVLFDPQNKPTATAIAGGLAALLLPFSLLGPFVGVFLDRWSRRQVLVVSNLVRLLPVIALVVLLAGNVHGVTLFALVLAALSVNRFLLAGLSAALPHVVAADDLVLANSVTPTSGTVSFTIGVGLATAARAVMPFGDRAAVLTAMSGLGYLAAGLLALRLPRALLGPDLDDQLPAVRAALGNVVRGLGAALRHLRERRRASMALAVVTVHRFLYGLVAVATVLLYRNTFYDSHHTDQALAGLALAVTLSGLGFGVAAVLTPVVTQRLAPPQWIVALLLGGAVIVVMPGSLFTRWGILVAAFGVGVSAQGVKICVDTIVQTSVDDAFRGRVFSLYDVLFNVAFVGAAGAGVVLVPTSGRSVPLLVGIGVAFALTGGAYAAASRQPTASA
jgi:MFS family permease